MEISIRHSDGIEVVEITGDLDVTTIAAFEAELRKKITEGARLFALDCKALDFIDSAALGRLVAILKEIRPDGGKIGVAGLKSHIRSTFELIRLDRFMPLADELAPVIRLLQNK